MMTVQLPGGILLDDVVRREAVFQPIDGHRELACRKAALSKEGTPSAVTELLAMIVASVGGRAVDRETIRSLCVGDRKHLLVCCCMLFGGSALWLHHRCRSCGGLFDVEVDLAELPVRRADVHYPFVYMTLGGRSIVVRFPTGADLEAVEGLDESGAVGRLKRRIIVSVDGAATDAETIDGLEWAAIETRLEDEAPDTGTVLRTTCTECTGEDRVTLDAWSILTMRMAGGDLFGEIDLIAGQYHWSENDILSLPRQRRLLYLSLIDGQRGMSSRRRFDESVYWQ